MCRIKNNYIILDARIRYIKKNYICARDLAVFWDRGLRMQPRRGARSATWLSREFVRFYANCHAPILKIGWHLANSAEVQHSHWLCILSVLHISAGLATSKKYVVTK